MRYRLMASYQGSPFEADFGPAESDVVLFAACPPPEELGFEPATGHWRKQLHIQDVQAVWESRPAGIFRGARCIVLDDLGDRLHIGYLGHDGYQAEGLGYWQVDRGVYELVAARSEVTDIVEERTEYPRRPEIAHRPLAGPDSGGYPLPGTPQDQALYLPPEPPQGQASYLTVAGEHVPAAPRDATVGADGSYGWPDGGYRADPPSSLAGRSGYQPAPDEISGVAVPPSPEPPLPLEAEALRAASASRRGRQPAAERQAAPPVTASEPSPPIPATPTGPPATPARHAPASRRHTPPARTGSRRSGRRRLATERVFAELATLAAIPADSYAIGAEVEGAMCLLQADNGFDVFHYSAGDRHELQTFATEEAACFYLFGVLAADAVRSGALRPAGEQLMTDSGPLPIARAAR